MPAIARETPNQSTDPELPLDMQQKAIDLDAIEVTGHPRVEEQEKFLDAILPCEVDPEIIFKNIGEQDYTGNPGQGSWNRLPKKPKIEKTLYDPFVRIATAIQDLSVKTYDSNYDPGRAEEDAYVPGSWVNCTNENLKSSREKIARVHPDIGLYTRTQDIEALRNSVIKLDEIIREGREEEGKGNLRTLERQRTREVFWHSTILFTPIKVDWQFFLGKQTRAILAPITYPNGYETGRRLGQPRGGCHAAIQICQASLGRTTRPTFCGRVNTLRSPVKHIHY